MTLKVFISHASEDSDAALGFYERLKKEGFSPWIDVEDILPGQVWSSAIDKAFNESNVILLLLSKSSIFKRGAIQKEIYDALEKLKYKLATDIYLIPILIEECNVPDHISSKVQFIKTSNPDHWDRILKSLHAAAVQQSVELNRGISIGPFNVFTERLQEKKLGNPGHDIDIDYPRFTSQTISNIAEKLNIFFAGKAHESFIESRQKSWDILSSQVDITSFDGRWDHFSVVYAGSNFLSIVIEIGVYGAGAAHPNYGFETFNFAYFDGINRIYLKDFFTNERDAVSIISKSCIEQINEEYVQRTSEAPDQNMIEWIQKGAGAEIDNFSAFTVDNSGFTFLFGPYQVAPYSFGRWSATVPFSDLASFINPDGPYLFCK